MAQRLGDGPKALELVSPDAWIQTKVGLIPRPVLLTIKVLNPGLEG